MPTVADVVAYLDRFAPPMLAAEWDNVGLLAGDPTWAANRILTCLTVTPDVVEEAIKLDDKQAESWGTLSHILRGQGDYAGATYAAAKWLQLKIN